MPDAQRHAQYRQHYTAYKALYPALKPVFHSAAAAREAEAQLAAAASGTQQHAAAAAQQREALHSIVSPSILSADFANLARDVKRVVEAGERMAAGSGAVHAQECLGAQLAGREELQHTDTGGLALPSLFPPPAGAEWVHVDGGRANAAALGGGTPIAPEHHLQS